MKVLPVMPMGRLPNPPRRNRATLSVRGDKHTVKDWETGGEHELDPVTAWELYSTLNGLRVTA